MNKSHKYNELSKTLCPTCALPLKERMLIQKEKRPVCFKCYQAKHRNTNNPVISGKEVRTGKVPGRKKGIYGVGA